MLRPPFFCLRDALPMAQDAKPRFMARDAVSEEVAAKMNAAPDPLAAMMIFLEHHARLAPDDLSKAEELLGDVVKHLGRQADEEREERERAAELKELRRKAGEAEDALRRSRGARDRRQAMDGAASSGAVADFPGLDRIRLS